MKAIFNKKGFTLIEVTIALAIMAMIVVILADMYVSGTISSGKEIAKSKLQVEAKDALEGINNNVKLSSKMEPSFTSGLATYTSGTTTLILDVPAIDSSNNFLYNGSQKLYDHIVYNLDQNNSKILHKLVFSNNANSRLYSQNGSDQTILDDIQSISFNYDQAPPNSLSVTTNLTLVNTGQGETRTVNVSSQAKRRNSD